MELRFYWQRLGPGGQAAQQADGRLSGVVQRRRVVTLVTGSQKLLQYAGIVASLHDFVFVCSP